MNRTGDYELTIIIPVYNEAGNMERLERTLRKFLNEFYRKTCVLFVNDGSRDQSGLLIHEICDRHNDFFYLDFIKNCGLSAAIKAGIDHCDSLLVGYMDADLQTSPEDFKLLLQYADEYELVMGIRTGRKDSWVKNVSSRIANNFRRSFTHDGVQDTGCPLKILHTDFARRIPFFNGIHRFLPAMIQLQHGKVKQIPVRHFERMADKSKFNLGNRLVGPLKDCFAYSWMKHRYINYHVSETNILF